MIERHIFKGNNSNRSMQKAMCSMCNKVRNVQIVIIIIAQLKMNVIIVIIMKAVKVRITHQTYIITVHHYLIIYNDKRNQRPVAMQTSLLKILQ